MSDPDLDDLLSAIAGVLAQPESPILDLKLPGWIDVAASERKPVSLKQHWQLASAFRSRSAAIGSRVARGGQQGFFWRSWTAICGLQRTRRHPEGDISTIWSAPHTRDYANYMPSMVAPVHN
jgi:hypothetical protein